MRSGETVRCGEAVALGGFPDLSKGTNPKGGSPRAGSGAILASLERGYRPIVSEGDWQRFALRTWAVPRPAELSNHARVSVIDG